MDSPSAATLLGQSLCRTLCDKSADARKPAALEVEAATRKFLSESNGQEKVVQLLEAFIRDFLQSPSSHTRKGGLLGIASACLGLGSTAINYTQFIVPPVLETFNDLDPRVRYYACEALYNIVKVSRKNILDYLPQLLEGVCKLVVDVDDDVANGALYVERLLLDVLCSARDSDLLVKEDILGMLVEKAAEHVGTPLTNVLFRWISSVQKLVPVAVRFDHLPQLLKVLLEAMSTGEALTTADAMLSESLVSLMKLAAADKPPMPEKQLCSLIVNATAVLVTCQCDDDRLLTNVAVLCWIHEIVLLCTDEIPKSLSVVSEKLPAGRAAAIGNALVPYYYDLTRVSLDAVLSSNVEVSMQGQRVLSLLEIGFRRVVDLGDQQMLNEFAPTTLAVINAKLVANSKIVMSEDSSDRPEVRVVVAALSLLNVLLVFKPEEMLTESPMLFGCLLGLLATKNKSVAEQALQALSQLSFFGDNVSRLSESLILLFMSDRGLMESNGRSTLKQLFALVDAPRFLEALVRSLVPTTSFNTDQLRLVNSLQGRSGNTPSPEPSSQVKAMHDDLEFCHQFVHLLTWVIYTAAEAEEIRQLLRSRTSLLKSLLIPWTLTPVSLVAVCLYAGEGRIARKTLETLGRLEPSVDFIDELQQLVDILETPLFARTRILLSMGDEDVKDCYCTLAMILPHTSPGFVAIKQRLQVLSYARSKSSAQGPTEDRMLRDSDITTLMTIVEDSMRRQLSWVDLRDVMKLPAAAGSGPETTGLY